MTVNKPSQKEIEDFVYAGAYGNIVGIEEFLDKYPGAADEKLNGYTALGMAGQYGRDEAARVLLERGAAIDEKDDNWGYTALMHAAQWGNADIVKLLLEKGADACLGDNKGVTALEKVQRCVEPRPGHEEVLALLEQAMQKRQQEILAAEAAAKVEEERLALQRSPALRRDMPVRKKPLGYKP